MGLRDVLHGDPKGTHKNDQTLKQAWRGCKEAGRKREAEEKAAKEAAKRRREQVKAWERVNKGK